MEEIKYAGPRRDEWIAKYKESLANLERALIIRLFLEIPLSQLKP
ncbi:MAG: hypothetical protein PUA94_05830 [Bacteroidales bacterium]|nr:hypothetical protein [Bacteroidales bacterium]